MVPIMPARCFDGKPVARYSSPARRCDRRSTMDEDDRPKRKPTHEVGMPIDTMSVAELEERVTLLEAEIARLKAAIGARQSSRSAADAVFKL
jgi:uncharacterized small protein (DUF1192 family)